MISVEAIAVHRAAEQMALIDRAPSARRVTCKCGCGRWAYIPPRRGRLPLYLTPACARKEHTRQNRERERARRDA